MQRFSEEEAQEILRRAARVPQEGEYTEDDLRRSAAELGISPEALTRAQAELREERTLEEFDRHLRAKMRGEAAQTLGIVAILVTVNLVTSPWYLWCLWVVPWFFLDLARTVYITFARKGEGYRRAFERWRAKRDRRLGEGDRGEAFGS